MKKIICDKIPRIIKSRKKLEEKLKIKITNRGKELTIKGNPEEEYIAEKVIDALNFGFPFSTAMLIKTQDYVLELINIKDYTRRHNLEIIRGRIIGKKGKALKTLCNLTSCNFEIKDNEIGIIGPPENLKNAQEAIISIIKGSKHSNVYCFLEKNKIQEPKDLGLKK